MTNREGTLMRLARSIRVPGWGRVLTWLYPPEPSAPRWLAGVYPRDDGLLMHLDSRNHIDWNILFRGDFEPNITALLRRWLTEESVFVDVGANIGAHALTAAALVGGRGLVLAFEPNPVTHGDLRRNVMLNAFDGHTRLFDCALGRSPCTLTLRVPKRDSAEGGNMGLASLVALDTPHDSIEVAVERLDEVCARLELKRCDVVKIDVQGFEAEVLFGMTEVLRRFRPRVIFEWEAWAWEKANANLPSVQDYLHGLGYAVYRCRRDFVLQHLADDADLQPHHDLVALHAEDPLLRVT